MRSRLATGILVACELVGCHKSVPFKLVMPPLATLRSYIPSDMRQRPPQVRPQDNGVSVLGELPLPKDEEPRTIRQVFPTLSAVKNSPDVARRRLIPFNRYLDKLVAASSKQAWDYGTVDPVDIFPEMARLTAAGKLLILRARLRLVAKDPKATADYLAGENLSVLLMRGPTAIVGLLAGGGLLSATQRAIQKDCSEFSTPMLRQVLAGLPDENAMPDWYGDVMRKEVDADIQMIKESTDAGSAQDHSKPSPLEIALADHPNPFDPKDWVVQMANMYRIGVVAAKKPQSLVGEPDKEFLLTLGRIPDLPFGGDDDRPWPPADKLKADLAKIPDPLGRIFVSNKNVVITALPAMAKFRADVSATRIILASNLYRREKGRWPNSLSSLVQSGSLKEIPIDPYDGMLFRYDPKRLVIWAVGTNGHDDGGHDEPGVFDQTRANDLVWGIDDHKERR